MANISEDKIREVVAKVLNQMQQTSASDFDSTHYGSRKFIGIYDDMNEAIKAAEKA